MGEVTEQGEADVLTFLGVELGGEDVVAPDGGGEATAVVGPTGDDRGILGAGVEAVDEVDVATFGDASKERAPGLGKFQTVPADLRDFESGLWREPDDGAGEDAEALGAGVEFLASIEQGLVADADTEERTAAADEIAGGLEQFLASEGVDAVVEGTDAGEDNGLGVGEFVAVEDDADLGADGEQGFVDAAEVA